MKEEANAWVGVVLETMYTSDFYNSVCDQKLQNCLTLLQDKYLGGEGAFLTHIISCRTVLFQVTFKSKIFCIVFSESYLSTHRRLVFLANEHDKRSIFEKMRVIRIQNINS